MKNRYVLPLGRIRIQGQNKNKKKRYPSLAVSIRVYSHIVPILSHSSTIPWSSHHHFCPPITCGPHISFHAILPTTLSSSLFIKSILSSPSLISLRPSSLLPKAEVGRVEFDVEGDEEEGGIHARKENWDIVVLLFPPKPASSSQRGIKRRGLRHKNFFSRFMMRLLSSQARSRGPSVAGRGEGSRIVRWSLPGGFLKGVVERDSEMRVRWHSFKIFGINDPGKRAGRLNAWIEVKLLDA
jgi:hypothetical protein